jgi:hypothetical protein
MQLKRVEKDCTSGQANEKIACLKRRFLIEDGDFSNLFIYQ